MTGHPVRVRGTGRVEVAGYGMADAEHRVEKELRELWPEARVEVAEVSRTGTGRIVEEFAVRYAVRGEVEAEGATEEEARRAALRGLRTRFTGSRYTQVAWEVEEGSGSSTGRNG